MAGKTTSVKRPSSRQRRAVPPSKKASTPGKKIPKPQTADATQNSEHNNMDVPIVGVGATTGGLEALQDLFKPLPTGSHLSFVIIQHLSSHYKSAMDQLLSRATDLPIIQIKNNLEIKPGCIYLSPPEKFVSFAKGRFRIQPQRSLPQGVPLPIDHFFTALAEARQEKAICVILSGSGSDGTRGLKAVKTAGGLTVVQSPNDAKYAR